MPVAEDAVAAANQHYKRSLTLRYLVALALAAILALSSYVLFRYIMSAVDRAAAVTAVSGSQRLLTQRVLAQCLLLAAADNDEARRDIKARLERGEYRVDPAEVGEMMLRRMRADRIR